MGLTRWIRVLGAVALLAAVVLGVGYLIGRPSAADNVLHELRGIDPEDVAQVGTTVVLADWDGTISLLDLESGQVHADVTDLGWLWKQWYAGRGEVALITTHQGGVIAYGHDGTELWSRPEFVGRTARPLAVFGDGTTVLRDCKRGEACVYRAVEPDGSQRWSQREGSSRWTTLEWYAEEVESGLPLQLPDQLVSQPRPDVAAGAEQEVLLHDPATGEGSRLGPGFAVAGEGVIAQLDTTDGACNLTIRRAGPDADVREFPRICEGFEDPGMALLGENVLIADGEQEILVTVEDGTVATVPQGLLNVEASAAGLIGLDETSWLFGTNDEGTMDHRVEADLLISHGAETIVATSYRQPWNPFAGDSVRHVVIDPVTGETCGTLEVTSLGSPTPLPGCRAVVTDPRVGESFVVGRP